MVRDLDALYVNFISGFELCLGTAQALRQGFRGPIYADLHSLFLGMQHDGMRVLQPLPDAAGLVRLLRRGPAQRGRDAPALARSARRSAPQALGAGRVAAGGDAGAAGARPTWRRRGSTGWRRAAGGRRSGGQPRRGTPVRPRRLTADCHRPHRPHPRPAVDALDPTGCGDVFGAAACARLLAGDAVEAALAPRRPRWPARNAALPRRRRPGRHLRGRAGGAVTRVVEVPAHVRRPQLRAVRRRRSARGRRRRSCCSTPAARSGPRPTA